MPEAMSESQACCISILCPTHFSCSLETLPAQIDTMPPKRNNRGKKRGPSSRPEPSPGNRRSRRLNSSPPPQTPRGLEIDMNDAPSSASVSSNPGSASREERVRNRNRKRPGKTGGTFLPPIRESSTINDSDTHSEAPEPTPTSASPTVHLSQPETPLWRI